MKLFHFDKSGPAPVIKAVSLDLGSFQGDDALPAEESALLLAARLRNLDNERTSLLEQLSALGYDTPEKRMQLVEELVNKNA